MRFDADPKEFKGKGDGEKSNLFLKLKDGESVVGLVSGEEYVFKKHWVDGKTMECKGLSCERCAQQHKPSFAFRVNFITQENGAFVPKILEQGATLFEMLKELNKEYNLSETAIKISRKGSTKDDTLYTVLPAGPANAINVSVAKEVKLLELKPRSR